MAEKSRPRSKTEKVESTSDLTQSLGLPGLFDKVVRAGVLGKTGMAPEYGYFSTIDIIYRYSLTVLLYYWCLLTSPMAFTYYTFKHHILWYGAPFGLVLFCFLPIMPVGLALVVAFNKFKSLFQNDWMMEGPGRVFFVKPKGLLGSFLWDCYLNQSMYVGQFLLAGTNDDAIQHTWEDIILTKDYWRGALLNAGARLPRELGRWTGSKVEWTHMLKDEDVVCKLPDAYLGIGDSFWDYGKDYSTQKELETLIANTYGPGTQYDGKEVLILEMVRPKPELGVHAIDVVTMRTPDDKVKVLSVLLWTDCTTGSSHSCESGYLMDIETEQIISVVSWYSAYFMSQDNKHIGKRIPGVKQAVEKCVRAHSSLQEKWLVAVGWDCMIQKDDQAVFFEGNFAGARTPRRMFLNWTTLKDFVCNYFWPFGHGNSARPGRQSYGGPTEKISFFDFFSLGLKSSKGSKKAKNTLSTEQSQRLRSASM